MFKRNFMYAFTNGPYFQNSHELPLGFYIMSSQCLNVYFDFIGFFLPNFFTTFIHSFDIHILSVTYLDPQFSYF